MRRIPTTLDADPVEEYKRGWNDCLKAQETGEVSSIHEIKLLALINNFDKIGERENVANTD